MPCSGDGDAGSRLVPCTFGTYRSPQDQGWLSKGRGGKKKRSRGVFQHQTPLHNDIPRPICLSTTKYKNSAWHFLLAFCADALEHSAADRGIGIEPAGVLYSRHISQTYWNHGTTPSREKKKRCCIPGFPLIGQCHEQVLVDAQAWDSSRLR